MTYNVQAGASTDDECKHQHSMLHAHQSRLYEFEEQAAKFGTHTPPHVNIEIKEIRQKISEINERIKALGCYTSDEGTKLLPSSMDNVPLPISPTETTPTLKPSNLWNREVQNKLRLVIPAIILLIIIISGGYILLWPTSKDPPVLPTSSSIVETLIPLPTTVVAAAISLAQLPLIPTAADTLQPTLLIPSITPSSTVAASPEPKVPLAASSEPTVPSTTRPPAPIAIALLPSPTVLSLVANPVPPTSIPINPPPSATLSLPSPSPIPPTSTPTSPPPSATLTPMASPMPSVTPSVVVTPGTIVFVNNSNDIYQMDATSGVPPSFGEPTFLITGTFPVLSPDGTRIAFASDGRLTVMDIATRERKPVSEVTPVDSRPSWSLKRDSIVFTSNGHLYMVQADGTGFQQLLKAPPGVSYPSWLPQSDDIIIFDTCNHGNGHIYQMSVNGGDPNVLINNPGSQDCHPSWSPDGKMIVFTSSSLPGHRDIYIWDFQSENNPTQITTTTNADENVPTWSPNGDWIVFSRAPDEEDCGSGSHCAIYVIDRKGHNVPKLLSTKTENTDDFATMPAWGVVRQ